MNGLLKNVSLVIPARYASQRFPGKILYPINGVPLIQRVYENVYSEDVSEVVVLTDEAIVAEFLTKKNIRFIMTSPHCQSGTERISSVISELKGDYIINIQGDEPLVTRDIISSLAETLVHTGEHIATLARKEANQEKAENPNVVKVVLDDRDNALYFSRSLIPFPREKNDYWLIHIGLYGYSREFLKNYSNLKPGRLEMIEKLEQLTFLSSGYHIKVKIVDFQMHGIDVVEDVEKVEQIIKRWNR